MAAKELPYLHRSRHLFVGRTCSELSAAGPVVGGRDGGAPARSSADVLAKDASRESAVCAESRSFLKSWFACAVPAAWEGT